MTEYRECVPHAEDARQRELQPLADALTIMVRGIVDVKVEQTGGGVYCVTGDLGGWTVNGDECGWSLTDANGSTVATGVWFDDPANVYGCLTLDPDTDTLNLDECEAAAMTFASAHRALAVDLEVHRP